jgi:hypothetical protein
VFVLGSTGFPYVDILFVPRHPLQILVPATQTGTIVLPPGATQLRVGQFESVAARAFIARFDLTDYDLRAASIEFRDPWSGDPLRWPTMFRAFEFEKDRKAQPVLLDGHPVTHKPFLCLRGVREYHEHPQHSGDDWLLYREVMNLFSIVMSVWRVSIDLVSPRLIPSPNGPQVQWITEEKV